MNEELMNCDSPNEMLEVLNKFYDLDNCNPSLMIKAILIPQLVNAIGKITNGDSSKAVIEGKKQDSVMEIFSTVGEYFNLDVELMPLQKQKIISNLSTAMTMLRPNQRRQNA